MQVEFDDGTLLLRNAPDDVPYGEWDDRVDEYRTRAYRYRALLEWAGKWTDGNEQATLQEGFAHTLEDTARAYPDLDLTQALHIEPRDYQQAALDAWIDHDRRGSVVLPTGSGKTFLGLQAIADAGVSTLVVTPTIDLMNQWHATLTNAFGDQLTEPVGVLGGGSRRRHRDHRHHLRQRLPLRQRVRRSVRLARRRRGTPPASPDLPADPRDDYRPVSPRADRHLRAARW